MQDGLDFIDGACGASRDTGRYLANEAVSVLHLEIGNIDGRWLDRVAAVYLRAVTT